MNAAAAPPDHPWHTLRVRVLGVLATLVAMTVIAALVVTVLLPSDTQLARRAAQALTDALGAPVSVGALHWQLLPRPGVELLEVAISQPTQPSTVNDAGRSPAAPTVSGDKDTGRNAGPVALQRVMVLPALSLASLWTRNVRLTRVEIDGATVPQRTLARLKLNTAAPGANASGGPMVPIPIETLAWRGVSWQPRHGPPFLLSGVATLDAQWRPGTATLQLQEAVTPTEFTLTRTDAGNDDSPHWTVKSRVGGGSVDGELTLLKTGSDLVLSGKLTPTDVEVAGAAAAFNRRSPVSGKASGTTTVSGRAAQTAGLGAVVASLQTDTRFTMGRSHLTRFDLGKAVRSVGTDTLGQTPLDSITGQMTTRNTPNGMVTKFVDIKARSGVLTAAGEATVASGNVDATLAVDLVDGLVGVPLRITGPTNRVKVSVPPAALVGAAVGTAVLPGVGTALGARLGAAVGRMFGNDTPATGPAPAARHSPRSP